MVTIGRREVDVEGVLDELGVEVVERGEIELACRCPFHDDRHQSFSISAASGAWICYAGCGEGNLAHLVAQVHEADYQTAWRWLEEQGTAVGREETVLRLLGMTGGEPAAQEVEPVLFYEAGTTYSYLLNRGFTIEMLKRWGVGKDTARRAVVLPFHPEGRLLGLIYRHIDPEVEPKYDNQPRGLKTSRYLFGWEHLPPAPRQIIVVEGPLDAMWLDQHGYPAVSLLGARVSKRQADLLVRRTRMIVLGLDRDEEGGRGTVRAIKMLSGRARVLVVDWPKKDAQDCTAEQLKRVFDTAVEGSLWLLQRSIIETGNLDLG